MCRTFIRKMKHWPQWKRESEPSVWVVIVADSPFRGDDRSWIETKCNFVMFMMKFKAVRLELMGHCEVSSLEIIFSPGRWKTLTAEWNLMPSQNLTKLTNNPHLINSMKTKRMQQRRLPDGVRKLNSVFIAVDAGPGQEWMCRMLAYKNPEIMIIPN